MIKNTLLPVAEFCQRRNDFMAQMPVNSIALISAGQEVTRSNDTEYPFCQNKHFYYLSGFNEPDAILALIKGDDARSAESVLFSREKDPQQEIWHGRRVGQVQAVDVYQFNQCFSLAEIDEQLLALMAGKTAVLICQHEQNAFQQQVLSWLAEIKKAARTGVKAPTTLIDCSALLDEMRLHKSNAELDIMRQVNVISGGAHQRAMQQTKAGKFEYQIEAELLHEFATNGARYPAYGSIVAGGDNANILHYTDNDDVLNDGDLLLIDAGGELAGYAADITRTFPINGRFTAAQQVIYQLVLDSQNLAIAAIKPEQNLAELNRIVCDFLTRGLHDLGILKGNLNILLVQRACKKYFIHGLGHWLGLDVHDVGDYHASQQREQLRPFVAGMVMTIEPGIYIPKNDQTVDEKWRGIGVRIEDNVLVTQTGYENLTVNAPKTIAEIEALMA
ncbi:Xaa-Pro aminopeptidase [Colwellia sp. MB02u-18]|uniref:Xaa-Pro aminopeptidase n=1 Tax=unclassified Colwellia TaxID=196834 RepID=UPI0015F74F45|nr:MULTISPECIES: Xaa-Pro aminopeptidase [unclassified Colwellia]MBA6224006.1 Xaa-Pro aminopeptidase [Colwellia sp. MB3u-45]MBA6266531.1 Xaa-Pro aminopeptidase [Colwellia sp. MB3u-43]MBA6320187.1 Xaa-Pro aminopeptidase [Colwellia sp. MB02u-19]MBA6325998.1 Xaa-Pro aminopeptidase [Colwellia sp. MB02u-18]MBA6332641.1 Xaa-Pro aminopeptidase [Colwellia sp. MB02u-12]